MYMLFLSHVLFCEHNDFRLFSVYIVEQLLSIYCSVYRQKKPPHKKMEIFYCFIFLQVDARTHQIPIISTYVQEYIISQREILP